MSSKRPYTEVDASASVRDPASKKRKQFKNHKSKDAGSAPLGQSLNEVKKRARDIERRFAKGDRLPADVQRNLERELAHCKKQVEDLQHKKKRSEMISRYHKVRFFERQKAERLRKQLKKRLDKTTEPEEKSKMEEELHIVDVDYHYTRYFPFMEHYISIYAAGKADGDGDSGEGPIAKRSLHSERPPMWKEIEAAMEKGQAALERIQERRPETETLAGVSSGAPSEEAAGRKPGDREATVDKAKKKSRSEPRMNTDRRKMMHGRERGREEEEEEQSGGDSDGSGFFD